ncbi:hypothetical protein K474DRAFT_1610234 [Panus rudis PR-1116 ss-1]|nr:hypothetical protein K474DRAFT_1610234 [Panus rudis PR-1116 ss-1]
MFLVGIIPGPSKPSVDQINGILRIVVDDLLEMWDPGVYFSRTHRYPRGRLVRCAMIPLVCDLPAIRQMSGYAGHSSKHFCSFCKLKKEDINNLNMEQWDIGRKTWQEHLEIATRWKEASPKERIKIFQEHGIRWSELLRLPYWDPTRFVLIDSMHALLLGCIRRHLRELWGMNATWVEGKDLPEASVRQPRKRDLPPSEEDLEKAWDIMQYGKAYKLHEIKVAVLRELCTQLDLTSDGSKKKLTKRLCEYVRGYMLPPPPETPTLEEMQKAQKMFQSLPNYFKALGRKRKPILVHLLLRYARHFHENLMEDAVASRGERLPSMTSTTDTSSMSTTGTSSTSTTGASSTHVPRAGETSEMTTSELTSGAGRKVVLGREVLSELWNDGDQIIVPSWLGRLPPRIGSPQHGKVSADQYRSLCTIYLVTTLIRLWAKSDNASDKDILENYMHLVAAINLANLRTLTDECIAQYHSHMRRYLLGVRQLYPWTNITPSQHLSLHLTDILKRFGPVHAWRCFPFERYNGMLQDINVNFRFGERQLEKTILQRFCMGQNIRALAGSADLQSELAPLFAAFQNVWQSDNRGTLLSDLLAAEAADGAQFTASNSTPSALKPEHVALFAQQGKPLLAHRVLYQSSVTRSGVTYGILSSSEGNSHVVYGKYPYGNWGCGTIQAIFKSQHQEDQKMFFVVEPFIPLSSKDEGGDPYRKYPYAGRLFYDVPGKHILLKSDHIVCHFACMHMGVAFGLDTESIHVLPLYRVSISSFHIILHD